MRSFNSCLTAVVSVRRCQGGRGRIPTVRRVMDINSPSRPFDDCRSRMAQPHGPLRRPARTTRTTLFVELSSSFIGASWNSCCLWKSSGQRLLRSRLRRLRLGMVGGIVAVNPVAREHARTWIFRRQLVSWIRICTFARPSMRACHVVHSMLLWLRMSV